MIYINQELLSSNKAEHAQYKKLREDFRKVYADHFSAEGKFIKPIVIKYREDLIKPDRFNKGLFIMPKSMALSFRAKTSNKEGESVEVIYSKSPLSIDPNTKTLKMLESSAIVDNGTLYLSDVDLAFFFVHFSNQNYDNPINQGERNAWFRIDNPIAERAAKAKAKQEQALYDARLWNEPEFGGLGEKRLRIIGIEMMILNADTLEVNELRERIDAVISMNPSLKSEFLDRTDDKDLSEDEQHERMVLVRKAIADKLFSQNTITRSFHRHDPETKKQIKKPIFTYSKTEKNPILAFYTYLEVEEPETITALKSSMALLSEA